jgi:hypothetical protein
MTMPQITPKPETNATYEVLVYTVATPEPVMGRLRDLPESERVPDGSVVKGDDGYQTAVPPDVWEAYERHCWEELWWRTCLERRVTRLETRSGIS